MRWNPPFPASRNGLSLSEYPFIERINSGIQFRSIPGCIPRHMEVEACNWSNYRYFHDWQDLTAKQRIFLIAAYITVKLIKQHQDDAERLHYKHKKK